MKYLMESEDEITRLELKTDVEEVRKQAMWCGVKPGLRILDLGCGTGKTTEILFDLIQPGGSITGVDSSEERINYAREHHGGKAGIEFCVCDLQNPPQDLGQFDIIWVRFVLEYFRAESLDIVKTLKQNLKPGGYLCLLDLDHNCLNHYGLSENTEKILYELMERLDREYNFDTYAGRKLYSYLYDNGYEDIEVDLMPHHLIYGEVKDTDAFNWIKKAEMASTTLSDLFEKYNGGYESFYKDFKKYFYDPRRFIYTSLILCKGRRPES
jgi:ubiquinone/menaquinone biosynthesis C-methylase UbiE